MACIDDKGNLTQSAKKLLTAIREEALSIDEISTKTALPLFKVRSSMRDMKRMGFVLEEAGLYKMNPKIEKLLNRS